MKKLIVFLAGAAAATVTSFTVISEAAAAPNTSGQTYAEAQAALTSAGYSVVVSTTVGDKLPQADCTVIRQQDANDNPFLGGGWPAQGQQPTVRLALNCSPAK